ncbi:MAG: hypothetical protein D6B28_04420 [Gammaproteobacteria bacterium]|nr:MAG: hypothetical protein D6B28_04420 [Gammaproteobacteria bacterium]
MKKKKRISISGWLFYSIAIVVFFAGFAGLFARQFDFEIPIISDKLFPIFDQYTVSTPGWASPGHTTEVVVGHHWVFLICLGLSILIAILGKSVSMLFLHLAAEKRKKKMAKKKAAEKAGVTPKKPGVGTVADSKTKTSEVIKAVEEKSETKAKEQDKKEALGKASEQPKPEPEGQHKSLEELTRKVSDIIQ